MKAFRNICFQSQKCCVLSPGRRPSASSKVPTPLPRIVCSLSIHYCTSMKHVRLLPLSSSNIQISPKLACQKSMQERRVPQPCCVSFFPSCLNRIKAPCLPFTPFERMSFHEDARSGNPPDLLAAPRCLEPWIPPALLERD